MKEKSIGAFEATSYIREFVHQHRHKRKFASLLEHELADMINDISASAAEEFRIRTMLSAKSGTKVR